MSLRNQPQSVDCEYKWFCPWGWSERRPPPCWSVEVGMVCGKKEKPTIWGDKKKSIQILCDKIHPNLVWTKVVLIWLYSEYVSSVVRDQLQIRRLQWPLVHARVWCTFELQISKHVSFVYCWWKEASKNNIGEARERSRRRDMETKEVNKKFTLKLLSSSNVPLVPMDEKWSRQLFDRSRKKNRSFDHLTAWSLTHLPCLFACFMSLCRVCMSFVSTCFSAGVAHAVCCVFCSIFRTIFVFSLLFFYKFNRHLCHGVYWCTHDPAYTPSSLSICIFHSQIPANVYLNMYTHFPPLPCSYTLIAIFILFVCVMFHTDTHVLVCFLLFPET